MNNVISYLQSLPNYFLTSLGIMVFIGVFLSVIGYRVSKLDYKATPKVLDALSIKFVSFFNTMMKGYVGKHWKVLTPLLMSIAIYVFLSNISGMFALDAPTKYTTITFSLSILAFLIIQITGIISSKWGHLKALFEPFAPLLPLNIIGEVTPIISLSLRLFGNIISGTVFLILVYRFGGWLSIIIAPAFHLIFDLGFGLIQAIVLILLTIVFTSSKIDEKDFN
jgi:F-type H+-transporting ATPase subunit a